MKILICEMLTDYKSHQKTKSPIDGETMNNLNFNNIKTEMH